MDSGSVRQTDTLDKLDITVRLWDWPVGLALDLEYYYTVGWVI